MLCGMLQLIFFFSPAAAAANAREKKPPRKRIFVLSPVFSLYGIACMMLCIMHLLQTTVVLYSKAFFSVSSDESLFTLDGPWR